MNLNRKTSYSVGLPIHGMQRLLRSSLVVATSLPRWVQDDALVALLDVIDGRHWVGLPTRQGVQVRRGSTTPNLRLWKSPYFSPIYTEYRWF